MYMHIWIRNIPFDLFYNSDGLMIITITQWRRFNCDKTQKFGLEITPNRKYCRHFVTKNHRFSKLIWCKTSRVHSEAYLIRRLSRFCCSTINLSLILCIDGLTLQKNVVVKSGSIGWPVSLLNRNVKWRWDDIWCVPG